jgi:hypothetical protein
VTPPLVLGGKKTTKLLPIFKGFQHLVWQQEGRLGLVWLGTVQWEEELGQGLCAKIKLPLVQSVTRECNSSTGLLLHNFLQQCCCSRTFFSLGHRLFGDGTQIPWDRNSKHFAFSWIAKVYVCVCVCVYINEEIKSDDVSLGVPVSALIVWEGSKERREQWKRASWESSLRFWNKGVDIFSGGWIVGRKVEGKGEDRGKRQARCVMQWGVSSAVRQHGLVVADMCQGCTNPFLKTRFVCARTGQESPSLSKPVRRRTQLMWWWVRLQSLLLELRRVQLSCMRLSVLLQ